MSLWSDYRDESLADTYVRRAERVPRRANEMRRVSKPFTARYGGYCGICDGEIEHGEEACFVEDELCHYMCAEDDGWAEDESTREIQESAMVFTFDPDEVVW